MVETSNALHIEQLDAFRRWLESKNWKVQGVLDQKEVLRMTHRGKYGNKLLGVYQKHEDSRQLSLVGESQNLFRAWQAQLQRENAA